MTDLPVPRLANGVEDLKIGQIIVWLAVDDAQPGWVELTNENIEEWLSSPEFFEVNMVTILKEPVSAPLFVSAKAVDFLQTGYEMWQHSGETPRLINAVRTLLQEAGRNV